MEGMGLGDLLPREHGTWAMLLVPWAVGAGVAGAFGAAQASLLLASVAAFLAHTHLAAWLRLRRGPGPDAAALARCRRRALGLGALAAAAAAPPLAALRPAEVAALGTVAVALGAAGLVLVYRRSDRRLPGQLLAPAALSFSAALAHAVGRGALELAALALWALSALFFLGGVLYVRLKILSLPHRAALAAPAARAAFAAPTLAMEVGVLALAAGVVWLASLSPWVLLAFASVAGQALVGTARLDRPASLKRVGLISTAHALLFAAVVVALA